MSTDTTTDATPPPSVPPPVPPSLPSRLEKNKMKYFTLGGVSPHVVLKMSKSFLSTQVRVSFTYVFELYFEYFARSFRGFLGVKKSFETDDEVYKLVYHPRFRKYYKHTDGGWAGSLVPDKLEELRCHLSWVMTTDVGEWGVQEISDTVERLFTSQLKKQFRELQLFHPTHYVTAHMKHTPGIATMKLHWP